MTAFFSYGKLSQQFYNSYAKFSGTLPSIHFMLSLYAPVISTEDVDSAISNEKNVSSIKHDLHVRPACLNTGPTYLSHSSIKLS